MVVDPITFAWGTRTFIMAILNITPDSFSGDGIYNGNNFIKLSVQKAHQAVKDGADILDIGGESTRPGSQSISKETEIERVVPVIQAIAAEKLHVQISVDTYKAGVARAAIEAGANWINDVWGLRADPQLVQVAADHNVPIVLMHNRSKPTSAEMDAKLGGRYIGMQYDDLLKDIKRELLESVEIALKAGVMRENIILDPGIGFGKTTQQNLELIDRLGEFRELGFPLLAGPSRKSFIGYTLDRPPDMRLEGTAAAAAVCITRGADILRVHNVKELALVARMTDAIVRR